ncbi:replication initiation protein [Tortoise microvirus 46]|nr:replication initiation protein [Tortoise microvirus 46]
MCIAPVYTPSRQLVGCRNCWQCRADRVNDLVGRCIAEQRVSDGTLAVTLTYRGDVPEAAVLKYRDVQLFLKRLRKAGYAVRYICAGEYGSAKGRAHWHIVLFFRGAVPEVPLERRTEWKHWPHGFSYFQEATPQGFRYLLKYALKDQSKDVAKRNLAMSKFPLPLGSEYFIDLALTHVDAGLAPQEPFYSFPDVKDGKGKAKRFFLKGKAREIFCDAFLDAYHAKHGVHYFARFYADDLLGRHQDERAKAQAEMSVEDWRRYLDDKNAALLTRLELRREAERKERLGKRHEVHYIVLPEQSLLVGFSDGSFEIKTGDNETWHVKDTEELKQTLAAKMPQALAGVRTLLSSGQTTQQNNSLRG